MHLESNSDGLKFVGNIEVDSNLSIKFHIYFDLDGEVLQNFRNDVLKYDRPGSLVPLIPIWETWCESRGVKYLTEIVGKWYDWKYWLLKLTLRQVRKDYYKMDLADYKDNYKIEVVNEQ